MSVTNRAPFQDRRDSDRTCVTIPVDLVVGDSLVPARIINLSAEGAQVDVDPSSFDFTGTHIDALYVDKKRVRIKVAWALYAGKVGVTFADPEAAAPILAAQLPR